jgi:hypothetical protein
MADKKVPLGNPLRLTDKQLDELSKVTETDIEKAKQLWRNTAPKEFETLLDAETMDDQAKP